MLCDYGCGQEAKYITTTAKNCCCERYNSCLAVRKKNAAGVSKAHDDGRIPGWKELTGKSKDEEYIPWNKGILVGPVKETFSYNGTGNHKLFLIRERGHKCESCKNTEWLGEPITLELEHIDADVKNNTRENLQILCPNCHSKTPTWKRGKVPGKKLRKCSDIEIIEAISSSENINQVLTKLDLRYGSVSTIIKIMVDNKLNFAPLT